ncbi:hypothetical protein [Undibacterium sp.]|nr:hypothetical protein [Undibacterium sp.]HTD03103.1 hypothetical protein [Undibacterium sp.]
MKQSRRGAAPQWPQGGVLPMPPRDVPGGSPLQAYAPMKNSLLPYD